jgi:hypothetical protein
MNLSVSQQQDYSSRRTIRVGRRFAGSGLSKRKSPDGSKAKQSPFDVAHRLRRRAPLPKIPLFIIIGLSMRAVDMSREMTMENHETHTPNRRRKTPGGVNQTTPSFVIERSVYSAFCVIRAFSRITLAALLHT